MDDMETYVNGALNRIKAENVAPRQSAKAATARNNEVARTILPLARDTMRTFARRFNLAFVNAGRKPHGRSHLACYELWGKSFWGFADKGKPRIIALHIGGFAREAETYISGGSAYQTPTKTWIAGSILLINDGDFKNYDGEVLQGKVNRDWLLDKLAKQYVSWKAKHEISKK